MAKSIRAKSQKRNRTSLRERVFKPVEDLRLKKSLEKDTTLITEVGCAAVTEPPKAGKKKVIGKNSWRLKGKNSWKHKEKEPFNFYGLSKKDYASRNQI